MKNNSNSIHQSGRLGSSRPSRKRLAVEISGASAAESRRLDELGVTASQPSRPQAYFDQRRARAKKIESRLLGSLTAAVGIVAVTLALTTSRGQTPTGVERAAVAAHKAENRQADIAAQHRHDARSQPAPVDEASIARAQAQQAQLNRPPVDGQ